MPQNNASFYFYDLETSGFSPKEDRIMQFAGLRTDENLKPIGTPHNILVKLSDDILPSPQAVLLTGITPQQTAAEGLTEAEFLNIFHSEIATKNTTFVGFNNIRFDDEFLRFTNYRNFHDAYEWHWSDNRSRWDILDLARMTRALRPDGIQWPYASDGRPSNRLEELSAVNKLTHKKAHDALSDVHATIAVAKLIKQKKPKLFEHLYSYRNKQTVADLVNKEQAFVYTSGKYSSNFLHTTLVTKLADNPNRQGALVYDLRYDPRKISKLKPNQIIDLWTHFCKERPCPHEKFPVKTLLFNRCPAVAQAGVLNKSALKNISLDLKVSNEHLQDLLKLKSQIVPNVLKAIEKMNQKQDEMFANDELAETSLYDNFISAQDKQTAQAFREATPTEMVTFIKKFNDSRLKSLVPLYIIKNFPKHQTDDMRQRWENFKKHKMLSGGTESKAAKYFHQLSKLAEQKKLNKQEKFILEELNLWGQLVLPLED